MFSEFFSWYLAPWRKIDRTLFNTILGVASMLPIVAWLLGAGQGGAGTLSNMGQIMQGMQGGVMNPDAAQQLLQVTGAMGAPAPSTAEPISLYQMLNVLIMVPLLPIFRMRIRDIGFHNGPIHYIMVAFLSLSPVLDAASWVTGSTMGLGTVASLAQFGMLTYLMLKPSA